MQHPEREVCQLREQVAQLQAKIAELRHSRQILMDLLGCQERAQQMALQQLSLENRRLKRRQWTGRRPNFHNRQG